MFNIYQGRTDQNWWVSSHAFDHSHAKFNTEPSDHTWVKISPLTPLKVQLKRVAKYIPNKIWSRIQLCSTSKPIWCSCAILVVYRLKGRGDSEKKAIREVWCNDPGVQSTWFILYCNSFQWREWGCENCCMFNFEFSLFFSDMLLSPRFCLSGL